MIRLLSSEEAALRWPSIAALLTPLIVKDGCYHPLDIFAAQARGEMQIWVSLTTDDDVEAAFVTRIADYPRARVCNVVFCAGRNMRSWVSDFERASSEFARAHGCQRMVATFRRGWTRVAQCREAGVIIVKDLTK